MLAACSLMRRQIVIFAEVHGSQTLPACQYRPTVRLMELWLTGLTSAGAQRNVKSCVKSNNLSLCIRFLDYVVVSRCGDSHLPVVSRYGGSEAKGGRSGDVGGANCECGR